MPQFTSAIRTLYLLVFLSVGLLIGGWIPRSAFAQGLHLISGRYAMPAVAVGHDIFVIGGSTNRGPQSDVERIHLPDGRITDLQTQLLPRRYHCAIAESNFIYVFGGLTGTGRSDGATPIVERYDVKTGDVTRLAPMPTPRYSAGAVLYRGKIYVIGGSTADQTVSGAMEIYDIAKDHWTAGVPMPTPRQCPAAVKDGVIYVVGGFDGTKSLNTIEAYSIFNASWTRLPDLAAPVSAHHMVVEGNTLYSFGDYNNPGRAFRYDFRARTWTLFNGGYQPSRHNAVVAVDGRLYVIGGNVASRGSYLDAIQVLTP